MQKVAYTWHGITRVESYCHVSGSISTISMNLNSKIRFTRCVGSAATGSNEGLTGIATASSTSGVPASMSGVNIGISVPTNKGVLAATEPMYIHVMRNTTCREFRMIMRRNKLDTIWVRFGQ